MPSTQTTRVLSVRSLRNFLITNSVQRLFWEPEGWVVPYHLGLPPFQMGFAMCLIHQVARLRNWSLHYAKMAILRKWYREQISRRLVKKSRGSRTVAQLGTTKPQECQFTCDTSEIK